MNTLFFSNYELAAFIIAAIPAVAYFSIIACFIASTSFALNHAALGRKIFNAKKTGIVRLILITLLAITCQVCAWKMLATLLFVVAVFMLVFRMVFWKSGVVKFTYSKY